MEALLSCARCQRHCHRRKASPLSLPMKSCQPHLPVVTVEETKAVTFGSSSPAAFSNMFKQHVQATWRLPENFFPVFIASLLGGSSFRAVVFSKLCPAHCLLR